MTPAEKMAQALEEPYNWIDVHETAALICRLAAALVAYDGGLELVANEKTVQIFRAAYADALRDAGVMP